MCQHKMNFKSMLIYLEFSTFHKITKVQFFIQFSDCIIYCYKFFYFPRIFVLVAVPVQGMYKQIEKWMWKKRKTWKMLMYMACPVRANFLVMNSYQMENNIQSPPRTPTFMQNWIGGNASRHWKHLYLHNNC